MTITLDRPVALAADPTQPCDLTWCTGDTECGMCAGRDHHVNHSSVDRGVDLEQGYFADSDPPLFHLMVRLERHDNQRVGTSLPCGTEVGPVMFELVAQGHGGHPSGNLAPAEVEGLVERLLLLLVQAEGGSEEAARNLASSTLGYFRALRPAVTR